jgi:hypothetical protein
VLDRNKMREHHFEVTFVLGRFMNEHLIRVYKAFDGDITAAIVLGTIGQYNYQRYYAEVGEKSADGFHQLVAEGEHLAHGRTCNAMSISESTGIPRETVRRKIRALIKKGWLKQLGPDKLVVTSLPARHFAEFNLETLEQFHSAAQDVLRLVQRRGRG